VNSSPWHAGSGSGAAGTGRSSSSTTGWSWRWPPEADGVHVGQDDLPVREVRRRVPAGFVVGVSAETPELAREAEAGGADYVGCGAVWPTESKVDAPEAVGPEGVRRVVEAVSIPVVAIGGITPERARSLAHTGVAGVAVIRAVLAAPDPGRRRPGLPAGLSTLPTGSPHPPRTHAQNPLREDGSTRQGVLAYEGRRRRTLPPGFPGSTIRAARLNFRVRDGNGCVPRATATDHQVEGSGCGPASRSRAGCRAWGHAPRAGTEHAPACCGGPSFVVRLRFGHSCDQPERKD
jgi:hypothetical protein